MKKVQPTRKSFEDDSKVSSASEWKKFATDFTVVNLPSGATVKVRRLNMFESMQTGILPLDLMIKVMAAGDKMSTVEGWKTLTVDEIGTLLTTMRRVVSVALVEPKFSADFKVEDIPESDLGVIFERVMRSGGVAALGSFR